MVGRPALAFSGGVLGILGSSGILWVFNRLPLDEKARGYLGRRDVSVLLALLVTAILGLGSLLAGYFPARRAVKLDPVETLREG